jgi:hypothetical protein
MRILALSFALVIGLYLPGGAVYAQNATTLSATCKDGTTFTGTKRAGACRGHGGVQSWGAPGAAAGPAPPISAAGKTTAPRPAGTGQVWVNTASNVYHCPGSRWYGKTKQGSYMSETQARTQGARPDHGKPCAK